MLLTPITPLLCSFAPPNARLFAAPAASRSAIIAKGPWDFGTSLMPWERKKTNQKTIAPPNVEEAAERVKRVMNQDYEKGLFDRVNERWHFLLQGGAVERIAEAALDTDEALTPGQRLKDERMVQNDTRKWCQDRCITLGYCDVVEDLYEMDTTDVLKFCQECASLDECELTYEKADEYVDMLADAAMNSYDSDAAMNSYG
jgi:hypothetical protein